MCSTGIDDWGVGVYKSGTGVQYEGQFHNDQKLGRWQSDANLMSIGGGQGHQLDSSQKWQFWQCSAMRFLKIGDGKKTFRRSWSLEQIRADSSCNICSLQMLEGVEVEICRVFPTVLRMDGEGTYRFANGRVYVGQWAMGHMSGCGKMEMPDGSRYEGGYETQPHWEFCAWHIWHEKTSLLPSCQYLPTSVATTSANS